MSKSLSQILLISVASWLSLGLYADSAQDRYWRKIMHPILAKHCTSCHNVADKKAGLDLDIYYYVPSVIRHGERWRKIVEMVQNGEMPPSGKPRMSRAEIDSVVNLVTRVLDNALADPDPGPPVLRRLTHREYSYTIEDLLHIDFDATAYFPKEGSGGEGFDNQSGALFMTPLMMERYYLAADSIVRRLSDNAERWKNVVPFKYRPSILRRIINSALGLFREKPTPWKKPIRRAEQIIIPIATKAFRGFISQEEHIALMDQFTDIYFGKMWQQKNGFNETIKTMLTRILVSPMFLYRTEINQPIHKPYAISNLELATRLSYLLWSSMPDDTLLEVAYREDLHNPKVLNREVLRMMDDPKFRRFAESFAPQWLGTEEAMKYPEADVSIFPEFDDEVRRAMHAEVVEYFDHVFCTEKNLLTLIDGDYSFINETLAKHYDIPNVTGSELRKVPVAHYGRGGILGMGAVLTATSLANRTSPVLRGQWVLEQIMGTPPPPPPPDVPELPSEQEGAGDEVDLRVLLEKHRNSPNCAGCHQKMDPIGFAMENFDAVGKYRQYYRGEIPIDNSAILENGKEINGLADLRNAIADEKDKFAENLSRKLMSYALGRGITFIDSPTLREMKKSLLDNNFNSEEIMLVLVNSYPFKHRRSDMTELHIKE